MHAGAVGGPALTAGTGAPKLPAGISLSGRPRPLIEGVGLAIGKHGGVATASGVVLVERRALRASLPMGRVCARWRELATK
jgi:hypothetical protein